MCPYGTMMYLYSHYYNHFVLFFRKKNRNCDTAVLQADRYGFFLRSRPQRSVQYAVGNAMVGRRFGFNGKCKNTILKPSLRVPKSVLIMYCVQYLCSWHLSRKYKRSPIVKPLTVPKHRCKTEDTSILEKQRLTGVDWRVASRRSTRLEQDKRNSVVRRRH